MFMVFVFSVLLPVTIKVTFDPSILLILNNLSYEIKDMKLRVQRAELQKRCQENNGCLDIDSFYSIFNNKSFIFVFLLHGIYGLVQINKYI
jgi:hypothetical protein